jgi:hypothetical protein
MQANRINKSQDSEVASRMSRVDNVVFVHSEDFQEQIGMPERRKYA